MISVVSTPTGYAGLLPNDAPAFTLTLNPDGSYSFTQHVPLDHPNAADANDNIQLRFGFTATDGDGDSTDGTIRINVRDDGPSAANDVDTTTDAQAATGNVVTGAGITNPGQDSYGEDGAGRVFSVDGQAVPAGGLVITGTYGTLTINQDGSYSYQPVNNASLDGVQTDVFDYTIVDNDGDKASATLTINTNFGADDVPIVVDATRTVDETGGLDTVSGQLNIDYGADGAGASVSGNGQVNIGNITSNGQPVTVTYNNGLYTGSAGGSPVFVMRINPDGTYNFVQREPLDHPNTNNPNDSIPLRFGFTATDGDGDSTDGTIRINVLDDGPTILPSTAIVDESDASQIVNGTVNYQYGEDGAGSIQVGVNGQPDFAASTSLTSGGVAVAVTVEGGVYIGRANGAEVFRLTVNNNGTYRYTQSQALDHPNSNDVNDNIRLDFGISITDGDGDTDQSTITINVLDDGPVAANDIDTTTDNQVATGNVITGAGITNAGIDSFGGDGAGRLSAIDGQGIPNGGRTVAGTYGTLVIQRDGSYTYQPTNNPGLDGVKSDTFTYTLMDRDGDTTTATLTIQTNFGADDNPIIHNVNRTVDETGGLDTVTGTFNIDYGDDGAGSSVTGTGQSSIGNITSNGNAVSVNYNNGVYTGVAGGQEVFRLVITQDGTYTFTQLQALDHPNTNVVNDALVLNFGFRATDGDGDSGVGNIRIEVRDDEPIARHDFDTTTDAQAATGNVITGAGITNPGVDSFGEDGAGRLSMVEGQSVPAGGLVVAGTYGTLTINQDGSYSYQPINNPSLDGVLRDRFSYTIIDRDGDRSTAILTIDTNFGQDDVPIVRDVSNAVDETGGLDAINGSLDVDYLTDGNGGYTSGNGTFNVIGGSSDLYSGGNRVNVSYSNNVYTGTVNGQEVFKLTVNANGTYRFVQSLPLDHPNSSNPNDAITLRFGYQATDGDGDSNRANITIEIRDDGPIARNDVDTTTDNQAATGNVITGVGIANAGIDSYGQDGAGRLSHIDGQGIPNGGRTVAGTYGTLVIQRDGSYTYQPVNNPSLDGVKSDVFTYTLMDRDGDTTTATLTINTNFGADDVPVVQDALCTVDETGGFDSVAGQVNVDFGSDAAGATITGSGSHNVSGITSNGQNVSVSYNNGIYTGTAGGQTVFRLTINNDGSFSFRQFRELDHPNSNNPDDNIQLAFGVRATDGDGDSANGTIRINVRDDGPEAGNSSINLDEDTDIGTIFSGNLFRDYGADDVGGEVFAGGFSGQSVFSFDGTTSLTVNGQAVTVGMEGGQYVGRLGDNSEVFRLQVGNDGQYTFTQSQALDHPNPDQPNEAITLRFGYTVEDGDGDKDIGQFSVIIRDNDDGDDGGVGEHIIGTPDSDILIGTDYDDIIDGNGCDDIMVGNDGADTFVIADVGVNNHDIISDYDFSEGDVLDLSDLIDANTYNGNIADYLSFDSGESMLYVDVDGTNSSHPSYEAVLLGGGSDTIAVKIGDQVINVDLDTI